ncbi:MAG: hypothetical protein ACLPY1_04270 [Terracidiphilus sp.]
MILLRCFDPGVLAQHPLYTLLPLAVAGLFTASVLTVHWFVGVFADPGKGSQQDHSISQGASR